MTSAVIFAGGKSSRMGKDKALLPWEGYHSMAEFQYRKLLHSFNTVYISSKTDKFDFDAPILRDLYPTHSPMVALASVFAQTQEEALFILSVDIPLLSDKEIQILIETYEKSTETPDILIARSPRGLEPLCGIYRRTILPHVKKLIKENQHRMQALLESVSAQIVDFDSALPFSNLNTPEEYQLRYSLDGS